MVRDAMDCVAEANVLSAVVRTDSSAIDQFVSTVQASTSTNALNRLPLVQTLYSGNQNAIGQVLSSLSQQFNGINTQALQTAHQSECRRVEGKDRTMLLRLRWYASVECFCVIAGSRGSTTRA